MCGKTDLVYNIIITHYIVDVSTSALRFSRGFAKENPEVSHFKTLKMMPSKSPYVTTSVGNLITPTPPNMTATFSFIG